MLNAAADFPIIEINETGYNLIPSRFPPVPLYERLNSDRTSEFSSVEAITNPRLKEKLRLKQSKMTQDETCPSLQNWNHAPFAYSNPEGSRFFNPNINCLEISCDPQTALATSVRKRERFLERTSETPVNLDMRMLSRTVKGKFADLRQLTTSIGKIERWALGFEFAQSGLDGVIFRSHLRPYGMCLGILSGQTLGKAVQGNHYSYAWDGSQIISLYSYNETQEVIDPLNLFRDDICVAA